MTALRQPLEEAGADRGGRLALQPLAKCVGHRRPDRLGAGPPHGLRQFPDERSLSPAAEKCVSAIYFRENPTNPLLTEFEAGF